MATTPFSDDRTTRFHPGQIWESPKGWLYRVISSVRGGEAQLRLGSDGLGRLYRRGWDEVTGWKLCRDTVEPLHLLTVERPDENRMHLIAHRGLTEVPGATLGAVTVNMEYRTYSLGYNIGIPDLAEESRIGLRRYVSHGWQKALIRDAIAYLANAVGVDAETFTKPTTAPGGAPVDMPS